LQHREAGPPATAELFSDLLSNLHSALWRSVFATAAAIHPAFQRSFWLNVIAPAVQASHRKRGPALVFRVVFKV
jgi:hypothetical protein